MFCSTCGAQNPDNARFCQKCGTPIEAAVPVAATPVPLKKKTALDPKLIKIAAIALVAILAVSLLFGGGGYKSTVNDFMDAMMDMNVKKLMKLVPDDVIEAALEEEGYTKADLKVIMADLQEEMDMSYQYITAMLGVDKLKFSYKIIDNQNITGGDLLDIRETYAELGIKVKEAKSVEVELTVKGEGMEETTTLFVTVMKVGSKWYIDFDNTDSIF